VLHNYTEIKAVTTAL
jgi:hypothetical protein